jgi:DNA replication protein DnaC
MVFTPRITRELSRATFNEQQLQQDFEVLLKDNGGFFFHGISGTGKTIYACKLLQYANIKFNNAWHPCFVSVPQLLEDIRKTISSNGPSELIDYYQNKVDWLVLDDIGVEKVSDWVLQTFYLIINHRYEFLKTTIFTSNYSLPQLSDRFGEQRIVYRIGQMTRNREFTKTYK